MMKAKITGNENSTPNYYRTDLVQDPTGEVVIMLLKTSPVKSKTFKGVILFHSYESEIGAINSFLKCSFPLIFNGTLELSNDEETDI